MQSVPVATSTTRPGIVTAFWAYCGVMIFIYLMAMAGGVLVYFFGDRIDMERQEATFLGLMLLVLCLPFAILYALPYFLPRKPWVWVFDLVLIAGGMTSCITLPISIVLLIYWIKPEAKAWFGRTT